MHSFWRLGSGARCDSPLYSTRLARRFVRLPIGTHSADAIGRPAMQRRPPSAATVVVIVVVAVVWSVMVGTPSFARSFVLSIVPVRPGPSIVGVQLLLCLCLCLCCPSWLCWLLVLMFCSGAFNVSSALVASTPQRNILARGTQQTQHSTRQTLSNRESQPATRDSRLSIGASCVCALFQLSSRRVASLRVFCFVISSQLTSSRCGCRVQGYLQQQWPPWPQLPARHLQQQQHQEAVAPYQETLGGLFPLLSRRVAPAKARK